MLTGSCHCKKVTYTIAADITTAWNCYCKDCSKLHGAAFATHASVKQEDFHWLSGEQYITHYETSAGKFRLFCSRCGSHLLIKESNDSTCFQLVLSSLDSDVQCTIEGECFTRSRLSWVKHNEPVPQFETMPPASYFK